MGSKALETIAVSGHEHEKIEALALRHGARTVHNARYRDGLSASLAAGIGAVSHESEAALIMLGDMPLITSAMVERMIDTFAAAPQGSIIMAAHGGVRGNPVLWPRRHFEALTSIEGDIGARQLRSSTGAT